MVLGETEPHKITIPERPWLEPGVNKGNEDYIKLIEEGIATWIFNHAQRLALFDSLTSLDYGLLKSVLQFVQGYEAEHCPLWLWEEAILQGYEVFRLVCLHRGGQVGIDLVERKIWFIEP